MFYDIFEDLCREKKTTPTQIRKDLNISQSTMASWKSRGLTPNATTLVQLAEYFHTTPAYLMGNKLAKKPVDHTGKTESYQPYTKTDDELIKLGGYGALAEFYNLPDDDQKEAIKDIKSFVEYTIAKYKKQSDDVADDKK